MKRISLFLMAFALGSVCFFTSCEKESDDPNAKLEKFIGDYDLTISEGNLVQAVLDFGTAYPATMKVETINYQKAMETFQKHAGLMLDLYKLVAENYDNDTIQKLVDTAAYLAENMDYTQLASITFTSNDQTLNATEWFQVLSTANAFGYVYNGCLYMTTTDTAANGKTIIFPEPMAYRDNGTDSWTAYYADYKSLEGVERTKDAIVAVVTKETNLKFTATRK